MSADQRCRVWHRGQTEVAAEPTHQRLHPNQATKKSTLFPSGFTGTAIPCQRWMDQIPDRAHPTPPPPPSLSLSLFLSLSRLWSKPLVTGQHRQAALPLKSETLDASVKLQPDSSKICGSLNSTR